MSYSALLMFVSARTTEKNGGGHIFSSEKKGSLCGIEKRFPETDREVDFEDEEFAPWLKDNELWVCSRCLGSYRKLEAKRVAKASPPYPMPKNPTRARVYLAPTGTATCYDLTGHEQIRVELQAGDIVEWKRNGQTGHLTCYVLGFSEDKIHLQPINRATGEAYGKAVAAFKRVSRAWRGGVLVGLPEPFEGTVLTYEVDDKGRGEMTLSRPGHKDVFVSSRSPGWPLRTLRPGQIVRVTAKHVPGAKYATFFVE